MGYRKIPNLYKSDVAKLILGMTRVYALEKIHGTSAHVGYRTKSMGEGKPEGFFFYQGGIKEDTFRELLEEKYGIDSLTNKLKAEAEYNSLDELIVYGEAYGGKCQAMSRVYGPLNFIAFEVYFAWTDNDLQSEESHWLEVPSAEAVANKLGIEFVHYEKGPATLPWLDSQRDKPSVQARRNGMGEQKSEGIVIRPLAEGIRDRFGHRILAKHKGDHMRETKTPRKVDPEKRRRWEEANKVAEEFVVPMRIVHVCDKLAANGTPMDVTSTGEVINAVINDVKVEEGDEIEWSKDIETAIGRRASELFRKEYLPSLIGG